MLTFITNNRTFMTVWFGQVVSNLGSSMTSFGLGIWVYQETGSATNLALIVLAARVPALLVSPFAGAIIDRWNRRSAMLLADAGAATGTLAIMILLLTNSLELWHLYLALGLSGVFSAFQLPAYGAAITLMVDKDQYARASGFVQLAGSVGRIAAPAAAAALVVWVGLTPLFIIDFLTFIIAVVTLMAVRFPSPPPAERQGRGVAGLLSEARLGLDFVLERPALLVLMLSFVLVNFAFAFQSVLLIPLLLETTTEQVAGWVVSLAAGAVVVGSVILGAWGGPKDRIAGVYAPIFAMGVGLSLIGLRPSVLLIIAGILLMNGTHPIAGGSSQAIWQSKVPPNLQGRVFAIRQVSAIIASPPAFLLAGWLADKVFEPLVANEASPLTQLVGWGPGRGIGLMFVLLGLFVVAVVITAWRNPQIRNLEQEVPDHEPIDITT